MFKILFIIFLWTGIIFDFFPRSGKSELSKDFLSKSYNGLTNELPQIFVIFMEISSWPCAFFTSSDLIIFDILQNWSRLTGFLTLLGHVDFL